MLDRLLALEPGVSARAVRRVTTQPGGFPQIMLVECLAQLAGIAAFQRQGEGGFLAALEQAEFSATVHAGDSLLVDVRILKSFGRLFLAEGEVTCEGATLLTARMTLGTGNL